MTNQEIYTGEDLGILFQVTNLTTDSPADISAFEFEVAIYNPLVATDKIFASTYSDAAIPIERRSDGLLGINILGKQTAGFSAGKMFVEFAKIDKATGKREIVANSIFTVKESKIGK